MIDSSDEEEEEIEEEEEEEVALNLIQININNIKLNFIFKKINSFFLIIMCEYIQHVNY